MIFYEIPYQEQSDSETRSQGTVFICFLIKPIVNFLSRSLRDATTRIGHLNRYLIFSFQDFKADTSSFRRKLYGIRQQVKYGNFQFFPIRIDPDVIR
ncbi:hypothetical protein D3C71_1937690 [compost metagenome]